MHIFLLFIVISAAKVAHLMTKTQDSGTGLCAK